MALEITVLTDSAATHGAADARPVHAPARCAAMALDITMLTDPAATSGAANARPVHAIARCAAMAREVLRMLALAAPLALSATLCSCTLTRNPASTSPTATAPLLGAVPSIEPVGGSTAVSATLALALPTGDGAPVPGVPTTSDLSEPGPYFVHRTGADLAVRHANGDISALWALPDGGSARRVAEALSPDGRWLAFTTGDGPDYYLSEPITRPLALHVWDLARGREAFSTPILHPGIRDDLRRQAAPEASPEDWAAAAGTPAEIVGRSVSLAWLAEDVVDAFHDGAGALVWSPDARHLAFGGALDGPSVDVYVLDTDGWLVTRASSEPTHVVRMAWSPDGKWILHEGADAMSRGAGYAVPDTTDVSAMDGSSERHVWTGSRLPAWSGHVWPDAWLGDHEAILHSVNNGCGLCDIVRIDAASGVTRTVVAAMEADRIAVVPAVGLVSVSGRVFDGSDPRSAPQGVQLVTLDGGAAELVREGPCRVGRWEADGLPFVWLPSHRGACVATAFAPGGRTVPLNRTTGTPDAVATSTPDHSSVSPEGGWRVLYGNGGWWLYGRDGTLRQRAFAAEAIHSVTWRPDGSALYWLADDRLWVAELPDGRARPIAPWPIDPANHPVGSPIDLAWMEVGGPSAGEGSQPGTP